MLRPAIASSNPTSSKTFNAFEDDAKLNTLRGGSTSVGEHLGQGRYKIQDYVIFLLSDNSYFTNLKQSSRRKIFQSR